MSRIVVAMSGGVDSAVATYLLKQAGHEVLGLFMSMGTCLEKLAPKRKACCSVFDAADARAIAQQLQIEFSVLDFKEEFDNLIRSFCNEYELGRTPNPCVRCNQYLKFGRLWEEARKLGGEFIATGHYAQIDQMNGRYFLKCGIDSRKDQSYMLFALSQEQLSHIKLPLGRYTKKEIREIAHRINLPVKDKPESQEICFVPSDGLAKFLKERLTVKRGVIRNLAGQAIGYHSGYQLYTIGQRHLGVALGKPVYVVRIEPQTNTLVVGDKKDVFHTTCTVSDVNWISRVGLEPEEAVEATVKIRYLHPAAPAKITALERPFMVRVNFAEPQPAITPGQAAVFYQNELVLGGGWISSVIN